MHISSALALALSLLVLRPSPSHAREGDLDSTFGNAGLVITDFGKPYEFAESVLVRDDGKILVAGHNGGPDILLTRHNPDGSLDPQFGVAGVARLSLGPGLNAPSRIALQTDGKVVVAGTVDGRIAVLRFDADGAIDRGFATEGMLSFDSGFGRSVALQPDGKIVVFGVTESIGGGLVVRLLPNGELDLEFGTGGIERIAEGTRLGAGRLLVLPDAKLLLAASAYDPMVGRSSLRLARYRSDGSVDATFGLSGVVGSDDYYALDAAVQRDGRILVAGAGYGPTGSDIALGRFDSDGAADPSFGVAGLALADFGYCDGAYAMAVQPDGTIVVAGDSGCSVNTRSLAIARFQYDGTLDAEFGNGGKVTTAVDGAGETAARAVAIQADGNVVIAGDTSNNGYNWLVARYVGISSCLTPEARVAAVLDAPSCSEPRLPPKIRHKLTMVSRLLHATDGSSDRRRARLRRKAEKAIQTVLRVASNRVARDRLSQPCGELIRAVTESLGRCLAA